MKPVFYRLAIAALTVACALTGGGTRAGAAGVGLIDASGVMRFPYGPPAPTLTCVPTYACTIILDPGEVVFDKVAGDTVRWIIATGVTGPNGIRQRSTSNPQSSASKRTSSSRPIN